MAETVNTMQVIEESLKHIDDRYDMRADNVEDIRKASSNFYELIANGFRFGYMQGMKAEKAKTAESGHQE